MIYFHHYFIVRDRNPGFMNIENVMNTDLQVDVHSYTT
jgi:hypothetical protein